ncbi:glycosyltransferase family 2 protein [Wohlfahrtiimonas chitiniclastica]|uniref:glycosyltransferase family 2 protein n=1 Tax=Wohlfahrtiimonas chitiniclastica TaxID=400946 RepID=UPI001BCCC9A0|nr:glycosyltransferase family A protein [Wohlfahrtiimonas chitiniclastica]MBS7836978.1 glycosyltransferase family 2 protein [Wohlfahrtiimonas chitiniclastica]
MKYPLISVIIPCFNSAKTIERAVLSVQNQTYENIEIICIDDGSTDETVNILYRLSSIVSNLIILKNNINSGPSHSRNRGAAIAKGEYIAFLDSDDYWHYQKLEIQMNELQKHNLTFIATKAVCNLDISFTIQDCEIKTKKISFNQLLMKNYFLTPTVLMESDIFQPFDEMQRYSEDYKLWLEIAEKNPNSVGLIVSPVLVGLDKFSYGVSGLSANLWLMEKHEIKNYLFFLRKGNILPLFAIPLSLIKFIKRLCVTIIRRYI